ncbi:hypothetical protein BJ170DRAFT_333501 [Xylariales sp. AK1849]|nr:hypothetical protein BJ170DRAFT_333501 [Xylariales sp. AK1849]
MLRRGPIYGSHPSHQDQGTGAYLSSNPSYYAAGGASGRDDEYRGVEESALTFDLEEEVTSPYSHRPQLRPFLSADDGLTPSYQQQQQQQQQQQHRGQQTAPSSPLHAGIRSGSPAPSRLRHQSDMPLTGDGRGERRQESSPKRFAGWLGGGSTPPIDEASSPDTTPKSRRGMTPTYTTPKSAASGTQSRFGFLASSVSALTTRLTNQSPASPGKLDDELFNLNVETALVPPESFAGHETFSPAAYKNLQANATGLLAKMQNAYRQRTMALHEMQAERSAEREEEEETQMRVDNLKLQLEQMAIKATQQEETMRQMMSELNAERKARNEERMTRDKLSAEGSMVSEDLGVDDEERKKWRKSGCTVKSDLSFDTDSESVESESVFSRSRSPTITTSATESNLDLPLVRGSQGKVPTLGLPPKPKLTREMTTFQKLMKGISGETLREEDEQADGCDNCQGQDASVAWDTVSLLRHENQGLKHRVGQLEVAVEGALDMINGIGL